MRKLLLVATIAVAGFANAKTNDLKTVEENLVTETKLESNENDQEVISSEVIDLKKVIRLTVHTTCGESFSEVVEVPDNFSNADYIAIASIVNVMACGEDADDWDVN